MNSRNNLLLGLAAGAALGYWMNSEKGRQTASELLEKANALLEESKHSASNLVEVVADKTTTAIDKGIEIAEKAKETTESYKNTGFSSANGTPKETV